MAVPDIIKIYCKELSPPDAERAILFYEIAINEAKVSYEMCIEKNVLPRQIFLRGYDAMYASASLFLVKKFNIKLDENLGRTHYNMRKALDFLTKENEQHKKLIELYELAIEKFQSLSVQYINEEHFAKKAVKDLMNKGYYEGKKANYYSEDLGDRKDPLSLNIEDAKRFIDEIAEPFMYIMDGLTNDDR